MSDHPPQPASLATRTFEAELNGVPAGVEVFADETVVVSIDGEPFFHFASLEKFTSAYGITVDSLKETSFGLR